MRKLFESTEFPPAHLPRATPCAVALTASHRAFDNQHEHATRTQVARRLARLKGISYAGEYDAAGQYGTTPYFVPSDTLTSDAARKLGIRGEHDLFGGVVPHAFVASKVITHSLVDESAARPRGWEPCMGRAVAPVVLAGYSAFARDDAHKAGLMLLARGPVRIKAARATGGRGQTVAVDPVQFEQALASISDEDFAEAGVVLEENLRDAVTFSVGQVRVGTLIASYHGVQRETRSNHQHSVYGGSQLQFVRGGFDVLSQQGMATEVRIAVEQARHYHEAVVACHAGFFASRINYDVVQGIGADGVSRSGVLEQSWRLGGATGAEIAALEHFASRPDSERVNAACFEDYGQWNLPPGATVYFEGVDPKVGPLAKYAVIQADANPT